MGFVYEINASNNIMYGMSVASSTSSSW